MNDYMGPVFEKICEQYLIRAARAKKLPFIPYKMGKWWGNNPLDVYKRQEYDADLERYRNGGYDIIRNYYATLFKDAWDVSKYVVNKKDYLEGSSKDFENALFNTSLPAYVIDAVASNIMSMKSHCCFRIENGNFLGWEGIRDYVGCGQGLSLIHILYIGIRYLNSQMY